MKRTEHDPTALPSSRTLVLGCLALAGSILLAAWILAGQLNPPERQPSLPVVPAPPPLQPTAAWARSAGIVNDARAVSALMLVAEGKWAEADQHVRAMYRGAPRGDTKAAREANDAGLSHFRKGDYASAIRSFDAAHRADPGDVEIANNLGYAYLKAGRVREGIPHVVRALQLVPGRSSAWGNLSEALAELGHDDASLAALLLMVRLGVNREEIRDYLAKVPHGPESEAFKRQAARALAQLERVPRS